MEEIEHGTAMAVAGGLMGQRWSVVGQWFGESAYRYCRFVVGIISGFNNKQQILAILDVIRCLLKSCNILLQKNCNKEKYLG